MLCLETDLNGTLLRRFEVKSCFLNIRVCIWLAVEGKLLTEGRMSRLGMAEEDDICVLYELHRPEDILIPRVWVVKKSVRTLISMARRDIHATLESLKNKYRKRFRKEAIVASYGACFTKFGQQKMTGSLEIIM